MKKRQSAAIDAALSNALKPPKRKPSPELNTLLDQYAPPVETPSKSEPVVNPETPAESEKGTPSESTIPPLQTEPVTNSEPLAESEGGKILPDSSPHLRLPYEVLEGVFEKLKPGPRVVLERLYRLTAGFYTDSCNVSISKLSKHCKIGATQVRQYLKELEGDGHIKRLGDDVGNKDLEARGIQIRVMLPMFAPPQKRTPPKFRTPSDSEPNKVKDLNKQNIKEQEKKKERLTFEDISLTAETMLEMLRTGISLEELERRFAHTMLPEDWALVVDRLGQST